MMTMLTTAQRDMTGPDGLPPRPRGDSFGNAAVAPNNSGSSGNLHSPGAGTGGAGPPPLAVAALALWGGAGGDTTTGPTPT